MKLIDILRQSLKSCFRNKKNIFLGIVTVIGSMLVLFSFNALIIYNNYFDDYYYKNIGFRSLNVFYNSNVEKDFIEIEKLAKIPHVVDIINSRYHNFVAYSNYKNDSIDGVIKLTGITPEISPIVVTGNPIGDNQGVAICPINFYPDSSASGVSIGVWDDDIILGDKILNTSFEITFDTYIYSSSHPPKKDKEIKKSFKVIGLYDTKQVMSDSNQCYISYKDIKDVVDTYFNDGLESSFFLFVDNLDNVSTVISEVEKMGYSANVINEFDLSIIKNVQIVFQLIIFVSIVMITIILVLYFYKKIANEINKIGLLKACGYTKTNIIKLYMAELVLISSTFYIINTVLFIISFNVINKSFLKFLEYRNFDVSINATGFIITLIAIVIIPLIATILIINEKLRLPTAKLLKGEE